MKKILFLCLLTIFACGDKKSRSIDNVGFTDDMSGRISAVCIEKHVYYIIKPNNGLAVKLDDSGNPVKCE